MIVRWILVLTLLAAGISFAPREASADEIRVAVASNFARVMTLLAARFTAATGHEVKLSPGSTGKHYAQIMHGAPFDLFFAADTERPRILEENGRGIAGTRFTYARGRLILWSRAPGLVDAAGEVLRTDRFRFLAIANPELAPYGRAAAEVLQALGLRETLAARLVRGENIGQTYQFVHSGNADLGFVAWSQVRGPAAVLAGSAWEVPQRLYSAIDQQAIMLKDSAAARGFIGYFRSGEALQIIEDYGYLRP